MLLILELLIREGVDLKSERALYLPGMFKEWLVLLPIASLIKDLFS